MGIHLAPFTAAETVKNAEIEGKNGLMAPEAFRGPRPEKNGFNRSEIKNFFIF